MLSKKDEEQDDLALYMAEARKHKVMTRAEEKVLAYKIQAGGAEGVWARNEFVKRNMRLVVTIARKYVCEDMPLPDLVQEGNIGLMRALEKFDPDRGFKFSTYASWWVRQSMVRSIHNAGAIRIPAMLNQARFRLKRVEGRSPHPLTDEEREQMAGLSDGLLAKVRALPVSLTILDNPVSIDGENETLLIDTVADPHAEGVSVSEQSVDREQFRERVERALYDVSTRDQELLFAWVSEEGTPLEELGGRVGLTRERVRQILMRILAKLRQRLRL